MFKICVGLGLAWLAWLGSAWLGLVCLAWRLGKSGQASGLLCLAWLGFGGLAWLGLAWLVGLAGAGLAGLGWGRAWLGYNSLLRGLRAPHAHCCRARGYTYHARSCDPAYCQESNADTDEQTNIFQDPYWCFPRQALIRFVLCVLILPCFMAPRRIALTPRTPLTRGKPLV